MAKNSKTTNKREPSNVSPELGSLGIEVNYDLIYEDSLRDLKFPYSLKTYDQMSRSSVVASILAAINTITSQVTFYIDPYDQSDTHKYRKNFVDQCLKDMETPFSNVIKDAMTFTKYGFSVLEKVYRFRRKEDGSKYDDGRVGIKYLPIRSQKSISEFKYDVANRKIVSVIQKNFNSKNLLNTKPDIVLPIDRLLIFKVNPTSLDVYGQSPLSDAYTSWRVLEQLRDIESVSANRNLNGIPHMSVPSEVMDEDSDDPKDKLRVLTMKQSLSRVSSGEQTYVLTPSDRYDSSEGGAAQYDFKLVTGSSSHLTALSSIISRYKNEVFQATCADILTIDDGKSASSSLTSNKQTMLNMFIEARIIEILDLINSDLIPDLFRRNGWDDTKTPTVKYNRIEKLTVAELAKAIQQLSATQTIPITVENTNFMAEIFGFPTRLPHDMSFEDLIKIRGYGIADEMQSRSGDGAATAGEGTSTTVSGQDANANNLNKS